MYTREQYMDGACTHEQYYGQYVTENVEKLVSSTFSIDQLQMAGEHFNGIPLHHWDALTYALELQGVPARLKANGDTWSLGTGVCVLKAAARKLVGR